MKYVTTGLTMSLALAMAMPAWAADPNDAASAIEGGNAGRASRHDASSRSSLPE
jgi:hypothetical protein